MSFKRASDSVKGVDVFEDVTAIHEIHLAPCHLGDVQKGIINHLDRLLLRYSTKLQGVPLCYSKTELQQPSAPILYENPCIHIPVKVLWTIFAPRPGARLSGRINAISREHVGLLAFGYFSALVHANHMEALFNWDEQAQEWKNRKTNESLWVEQEILFEIVDVLTEGPVLTIIGSFDRLLENAEEPMSPRQVRQQMGQKRKDRQI